MSIRLETLSTGDKWVPPTGSEIKTLMRVADLTSNGLALLVGLSTDVKAPGNRTVRRWTSGDATIPYAAWALLAHAAGLGMIWVKNDDAEWPDSLLGDTA